VRSFEATTPVSSSNWNQIQLSTDDGTTDSGGNFLAALVAETDVAGTVTDDGVAHEAVTLTGRGHLLDGLDAADLGIFFGGSFFWEEYLVSSGPA